VRLSARDAGMELAEHAAEPPASTTNASERGTGSRDAGSSKPGHLMMAIETQGMPGWSRRLLQDPRRAWKIDRGCWAYRHCFQSFNCASLSGRMNLAAGSMMLPGTLVPISARGGHGPISKPQKPLATPAALRRAACSISSIRFVARVACMGEQGGWASRRPPRKWRPCPEAGFRRATRERRRVPSKPA